MLGKNLHPENNLLGSSLLNTNTRKKLSTRGKVKIISNPRLLPLKIQMEMDYSIALM